MLKNFSSTQKRTALVLASLALSTTQSMAALAIDTTAIAADIGTAGSTGVTIALLVGGAVIAFGLVKRFIR